jgi:hypothetical protein
MSEIFFPIIIQSPLTIDFPDSTLQGFAPKLANWEIVSRSSETADVIYFFAAKERKERTDFSFGVFVFFCG